MSRAADLDLVDDRLPRRLSVRKGHPCYRADGLDLSGRIAVLLNGRELPEVESWDVDRREIVRIIRHDDGTPITDTAGIAATETLRGKVEVRWKNRATAHPRQPGESSGSPAHPRQPGPAGGDAA